MIKAKTRNPEKATGRLSAPERAVLHSADTGYREDIRQSYGSGEFLRQAKGLEQFEMDSLKKYSLFS